MFNTDSRALVEHLSSQRDNRDYLYKAFLTECLFSFRNDERHIIVSGMRSRANG